MADYITEMANQIVAMSRRIDAIESDRVARMAELERKLHERIDTLVAGCNSHSRRIEALEGSDDDCAMLTRTFHKRIEALEAALKDKVTRGAMRVSDLLIEDTKHEERIATLEAARNDAFRDIEFDRESDRQDRWHNTRDAFVAGRGPCYSRNDAEYAAYTDALHKAAKDFADRAHGPLEARAPVYPDGMPIEQDTLPARPPFHVAQERANAHTAFAPNVEALVKAARLALTLHLRMPGDVNNALIAALKPFEQERGE